MSQRPVNAAPACLATEFRIGDRFHESDWPRRIFELVEIITPCSGVLHGRLRNIDRPHEVHIVSLRALGDIAGDASDGDGGAAAA